MKLSLSLFLALAPLLLFGQRNTYSIQNFTTQNGLPQNSVKDIEEDKWGFLWLTTENGLVRFDGKNFKVFGTHNVKGLSTYWRSSSYFGVHNSFGLTSDRMQLIAADRNGELYAQESGPQAMKIVKEKPGEAPVPRVLGHWTACIPKTGYTLPTDAVFKPRLFTGLWSKFETGRKDLWSPGFVGIRDNEAYLDTPDELVYVKDRECRIIENEKPGWYALMLIDDHLIKLSTGNHVKTWKDGVLKPHLARVYGSLASDTSFLQGHIKLFSTRQGTFIYAGKALHRVSIRNQTLFAESILTDLDIPEMKSLYYSKEKNIYFIGSETNGLFLVQPASFRYPSLPAGVSSEIFYTQALIGKNKLFARNILFAQNGPAVPTPSLVLRESQAYHLTRDSVLYYERSMQLYAFDFKTSREKWITDLGSRLVTIIEHPEDKRLFVFSVWKAGILVNDSLTQWTTTHHVSNKATHWAGNRFLLCTNEGVKWYDFSSNTTVKSILDSVSVRTTYRDKQNRLWISSYGKGFYLLDSDTVCPMPMDKKRALATVHSFVDAEPGYFWLPTNNGLFRVAVQELLDYASRKRSDVFYFMFGQNDGLRTTEFNGGCNPSHLTLPDGMVSLPSMDGLVWFYPKKLKPVFPDKPILIDQLLIDGKQVKPGNAVDLQPDFIELNLDVTTPFFGNEENMQLEYRITGFRDEWAPIQDDGRITLNNVRAGDYGIQVRKRNGKLKDNYDQMEFALTVAPFFYNTWWFYTLTAIAASVVIYLFVQSRFRAIRERALELENLVTVRTSQLSEKILELSISQDTLKESNQVKDRIITIVLHDLRSPIRFLSTISTYLSRNYRSLTIEELKESTDELKISTAALNNFTEQFFAWISSHREIFTVSREIVPVEALFGEVRKLYDEIVRNEGNSLVAEPTTIECYTDRYILDTIIRNLVDNANKSTRNGVIRLSAVRAAGGSIVLSVSDTGRGLPDHQMQQINQGIASGKGVGLAIIFDLIKKIGGELAAENSPEGGSVFTVTLPSPPKHYAA